MRQQQQHQLLGRHATQADVPSLGLIPYDQVGHRLRAETRSGGGGGDEGGQ